ncbi:MAG: hypothetical protein ACKOJC_07375, partial [Actinomycetota bacterium]
VTKCSNVECTSSMTSKPAPDRWAGIGSSITYSGNQALIVHFDADSNTLLVTSCADAKCSSGTTAELDPTAGAGWTSITTTDAGLPVAAFLSSAVGNLRLVYCKTETCS